MKGHPEQCIVRPGAFSAAPQCILDGQARWPDQIIEPMESWRQWQRPILGFRGFKEDSEHETRGMPRPLERAQAE